MSEWIPFEDFEPVYSKSYFVTLKNHPELVECVNGRALVGANNVLAVKEVEMPDPYVPPKPVRRECWVSGGENGVGVFVFHEKPITAPLGDAKLFREVLPDDPHPDLILEVVAEMRERAIGGNERLLNYWADRLEGEL